MPTISVRTTQNVLIDYLVAGVWDRILAFLIDLLIFIAYLILAFVVAAKLKVLDDWVFVVIYLPVFFYNLAFEILMDGQTPGKRALGLKVVRLDGNSPTIANYIFRFILWPIDVLFFGSLAITLILFTKNGQRLGDLAGGTTVVKLKKEATLSSAEIVRNITEEYQPQFPAVVQLSDRDMELIREALRVNADLGNQKPMLALTEKVKEILGIETDLPPPKFLNTVLKDYQHLTAAM